MVVALLGAWIPMPLLGAPVTPDVLTRPGIVTNTVVATVMQPTNPRAAQLVTLVVLDSTVRYVVRELARQAHLRAIDDGNAALARRIDVNIHNMKVMNAFTVVLRGTGLVAKLASDGETVVVSARAVEAGTRGVMQGGAILGRVVDSVSGKGLGGATVRVQGTRLSVTTADSGQFTLRNVPPGDEILVVRLFGYRPVTRTVTVADSERITVHIVMAPVPTVLSGVVTTAAGLKARYEVGNDITVLNADSIQRIAPVSNLTDMLETRVPGLIVQHTSGIPGAPSRLRLRGISSAYQSSDPILIVDGVRMYADQSGSTNPLTGASSGGGTSVHSTTGAGMQFDGPSPLDQIDPNSIETIEVLKGPSATAIYGSDAATGVIVITTKRGRVGPTHWTVTTGLGNTTLPGAWPTNYFRFGESKATFDPRSQICSSPSGFNTPTCVLDSIVAFQALNDPRYSPLTGHPGQNRDGSLTVSGGSGALTYSVTGSISAQTGYLHLPASEVERFQKFHGFSAPTWMRTPDSYDTWGGTSQLNVQLGKSGSTIALTSSVFRSTQQQSSLQSDLQNLEYLYVDTTQLATNPLFSNYYTQALLHSTTVSNAVTLNNWAPWHWLPITAAAGINVQNLNNTTLTPRDYVLGADDSLGAFALNQGTNTSATLHMATTLASQRLVSTAVGIDVYTLSQSGYSASTVGLPIGVSVPTAFAYSSGNGPSYTSTNTATYGWFVQPTLNLNSRFFVSPGFRLDGGSNSGAHTSAGVSGIGGSGGSVLSLFPKLDFSWLAVTRPPSHPLLGLTLLRPRIAFGIAGVQPGPAEQLRLLQPGQVESPTFGGGATTPADILELQTLGNTKLHPERDQELEGGIDAQFWNQRLSVSITGYHKMAYDAILAIPVAPSVSTPFVTAYDQTVNIGTIRNSGLELTGFARLADNRLLDWSVNGSVTQNRNLLVALARGRLPIVNEFYGLGYSTRLVPGYPLNGVWAQPIVSVFDANHNGVIGPDEVVVGDSSVFLGAQAPNYESTISTTIGLFNDRLSLNTSVDYQHGLTQVDAGALGNQLVNLLNTPGISEVEQGAILAALGGAGHGIGGQTAYGVAQTVNLLRWNTLSISYLMPQRITHLFRANTLSIALQGSNLALHTNYRGKDPNVNAFSTGNLTQDDGNALPQPRTWSLKINVGN